MIASHRIASARKKLLRKTSYQKREQLTQEMGTARPTDIFNEES